MAKDTLFGCHGQQCYKRIFLAAVAIRAAQYNLNKNNSVAERYISCLRLYFSATLDPLLSTFEVRSLLYSCLSTVNKLELLNGYCHEFYNLMPECPAKLEPRRLCDIARCQVREGLNACKLPLPEAVEKLLLPKSLKSFVLGGDDFDISRKGENFSALRAITQCELAEMLSEQPML